MNRTVSIQIIVLLSFFLSYQFQAIYFGKKVGAKGLALHIATDNILNHNRFCALRAGAPLLGLGAGGGKCTKPIMVQYNIDENPAISFLDPRLSANKNSPANLIDSPVDLIFTSVTSSCQPGGEEQLDIVGQLESNIDLPQSLVTVNYVLDENNDGMVQDTEQIIFQENLLGNIEPDNPLFFNSNFNVAANQICGILATLEAANIDLQDGVELPLPIPQILNAGEDQSFCKPVNAALVTQLGDANCGNMGYTYNWTSIPPELINNLDAVDIAAPELDINWGAHFGETLVFVLETTRPGCTQPTADTIQIYMPAGVSGFIVDRAVNMQAIDCGAINDYCLGIPFNEINAFETTINGQVYPPGEYVICQTDEAAIRLIPGEYEVALTNNLSGCSDTVLINITCPISDTLDIGLTLNQSDTVCLNSTDLIGEIDTLINICFNDTVAGFEIIDDSCVVITGEWVGQEMACFIICDDTGVCDTTALNIDVLHPLPEILRDTVGLGQTGQYCFFENQLNIDGPILVIENICAGQSGTYADFSVDYTNKCFDYTGLDIGQDTACIRLCDVFGNCDTLTLFVAVVPGSIVYDTVFISIDTNEFCIPNDLLPGEIKKVEDICPANNGEKVIFSINGNCISYYGDEVGREFICLRIEDEFGNVAMLSLVVNVITVAPETFFDIVFIGQVKEYCLDTLELPGNFSFITEICPDAGTPAVDFDINPVSLCVIYDGQEIGLDSNCIIVCDDLGFCDTTYMLISVEPYFDAPGLTDDTTSTAKETPVVIAPLSNDTVYGGLVDYFILEPPISGQAIINLDGSVTYTPDPPFCARWDQFEYVACNPNGCDTATVNIFIECIELTVFNAVSPNNDGVNDFFYIAKIENIPDNRLWVYNRWGSLVFDSGTEGYKNNWPGSWGDDIELPDGTYFYILEWTDDEVTTVQRGYFEMFR